VLDTDPGLQKGVSRRGDVPDGVDVAVTGLQSGIDEHTTAAGRQPRPAGQFDVGFGPDGHQQRVGGDGGAVGQGEPGRAPRADRHAQAQLDAVGPVGLGEELPDFLAETARQRKSGTPQHGDVEPAVPGGGGDLQADPPGADDGHRAAGGQRGVQAHRVPIGAQGVHAGVPHVDAGQRTGARTGGQQQFVVAHDLPADGHGVRGGVDRGDPGAGVQLDPVAAIPVVVVQGEIGPHEPPVGLVVGAGDPRRLGLEKLQRQRDPVVGCLVLGAEQHDPAVELGGAQRLGGAHPGDAGADDDDGARIGAHSHGHLTARWNHHRNRPRPA